MIRRWFFAGLLVWIPLGATLLVVRFLFGLLDSSLLLVPPHLRPPIPGIGVVISIVLVLATGAFAANFLGRRVLTWAEGWLNRLPLVRSVYGGMKKITETLFSGASSSFRKVVLIEYPRPGMYSVGFLAAPAPRQTSERVGRPCVTVFVPTTPNPTSGFIVQLPEDEVVTLDMSVEQGMHYIISIGLIAPESVSGVPGATPAATSAGSPG
jgi:Uncharacterized conserved protein